MTDKLTPDERAIVESKRGSGMLSTREVIRIIDRLAPKPEPELLWVNVWQLKNGNDGWSAHTCKIEADDDRDCPGAHTYRGRWVLAVDGSSATWEGSDV